MLEFRALWVTREMLGSCVDTLLDLGFMQKHWRNDLALWPLDGSAKVALSLGLRVLRKEHGFGPNKLNLCVLRLTVRQ